jgi:nitrogen-specific signal transduction histidine kinase
MSSPEADTPTPPEEVHDLLSTLYHDLNNPLSIIAGNAQFLRELIREADLGEPYASSVDDIQEAAERISDALNELVVMKERMNDEM